MQLFSTAIGLGAFDGAKFKNEDAFITKYRHEITDVALLNILKDYSSSTCISAIDSKKGGNVLLNIQGGTFVLNAFINALKINWS